MKRPRPTPAAIESAREHARATRVAKGLSAVDPGTVEYRLLLDQFVASLEFLRKRLGAYPAEIGVRHRLFPFYDVYEPEPHRLDLDGQIPLHPPPGRRHRIMVIEYVVPHGAWAYRMADSWHEFFPESARR